MGNCPFRRKCTQKVGFDKYSTMCTNPTEDKFKNCDVYKNFSLGEKKPSEWMDLTSLF